MLLLLLCLRAGRSELPDNLKALLRPVSMMVPDFTLIAEILMFSEGFSSAKVLAKKMVAIMELSQQQLSKQDHYDYGLRLVQALDQRSALRRSSLACVSQQLAPERHMCTACSLGQLVPAGNWLHLHRRHLPAAACRSFVIPIARAAGSLKRVDPDTSEELILYRTMLDLIKPKLVYLDLPLFMALLSDLFPGVEMPALDGGVLRAAIEQDLRDSGLQVGCEAG